MEFCFEIKLYSRFCNKQFIFGKPRSHFLRNKRMNNEHARMHRCDAFALVAVMSTFVL